MSKSKEFLERARTHSISQMAVVPGSDHYSTRNWSSEFVCLLCGKTQRANTNFLGNKRKMYCNGNKIQKLTQPQWLTATEKE